MEQRVVIVQRIQNKDVVEMSIIILLNNLLKSL